MDTIYSHATTMINNNVKIIYRVNCFITSLNHNEKVISLDTPAYKEGVKDFRLVLGINVNYYEVKVNLSIYLQVQRYNIDLGCLSLY